jgi:hypothetical protein
VARKRVLTASVSEIDLCEGVSGTVAFPAPSSSSQAHVAGDQLCQIALGSSLLVKAIAVQREPRVTCLRGGEAPGEYNNQSDDEPYKLLAIS